MKNRTVVFTVVHIIVLLIGISISHAWIGEPSFEPISRKTILRIADEMTDFSWTPKNDISNWLLVGKDPFPYYSGTVYKGEAYSQSSIPDGWKQENWAEFYNLANNTSGGSTVYGNDCAGFVSMSWRLPERYTTVGFESDALSDGGYVTSLGAIVTSIVQKAFLRLKAFCRVLLRVSKLYLHLI